MHRKRTRLFGGIHGKIFRFYALLTVFAIVFLGVANLWLIRSEMRDKIAGTKLKTVEQVGGQINTHVEGMVFLLNKYTTSPDLQSLSYRILRADDDMQRKRYDSRMGVEMYAVNSTIPTNYGITSVLMLGDSLYTSWHNPRSGLAGELRHVWSGIDDAITWYVGMDNPQGGIYQKAIGAYKPMRNLYTGDRYGGVLLLSAQEELDSIFRGSIEAGETLLILDGEEVLFSSTGELPGALPELRSLLAAGDRAGTWWRGARLEGEEHIICATPVARTGWQVVSLMPTDIILRDINRIQGLLVLLLGACIVVSAVASFAIARSITQPLRSLTATMTQVSGGALQAPVDLRAPDEIGQLAAAFEKMLASIHHLMEAQRQRAREKRELESQLLRNQLNPHFVNNTLNTVKILSRMQDWQSVNKVVSCLTAVLRSSLSSSETVPVSEELRTIQSYLQIQYIADMREFSFTVEADPACKTYPLPRLLLQPLVENCISHGYNREAGGFAIRVEVEGIPGGVRVRVADNGQGMPPERLEEILRDTVPGTGHSCRVGIANVRARMAVYYRAHTFTMHSAPGGGTEVLLELQGLHEDTEIGENGEAML